MNMNWFDNSEDWFSFFKLYMWWKSEKLNIVKSQNTEKCVVLCGWKREGKINYCGFCLMFMELDY